MALRRARSKAAAAQKRGFFDAEIAPVTIAQRKGDPIVVTRTSTRARPRLAALAKLKGVVAPDGTVTPATPRRQRRRLRTDAGREIAAERLGLTPRARVMGMATAGVPPRVMGIGPAPATRKVLELTGLTSGTSTSSSSTRPSRRRAWRCCANSAWPTTTHA